MAVIDITIKDRIASTPAGVELVCNNPTDTIRFTFDEEWNARTERVARFAWGNGFVDVPFAGNTVKAPEITNTIYVFVGVYSDDITTTPVKLNCKRSIRCLGKAALMPPDHTQWHTWQETVEALYDAADAANIRTNARALGVLPGEDCSVALQNALAISRTIYFPSGEYTFSDVVVTQDTVFMLAPDAHFHTESTRMLTAYNCSLSIFGGTISCGTNYPDRPNTPYDDASRKLIYRSNSHNEGVIELYGCHDCVFEGITIPYCSAPSVVMVYGDSRGKDGERPVTINGESVVPDACTDIRFNHCVMNNTLLSAIHVLYHCKNVVVDGCTFTNALRGTSESGTPINYCYTIYTGVKSVGVNGDIYLYYTPTDGYVFRNCYVENCEGTGVDTHAASNVLYENNTFIDCNNFITAYHDYRRVYTAEGWVMENVIVRNNRCITTKAFDYQGDEFPHNPFMLHNQGPEGTMRNVVVENNLIDTNWYCLNDSGGIMEMVALYSTDGVVLRNNTIISRGETAIGYYINRCNGVVIENQTFEGAFNYGFRFATSVVRMGAVFCMGATFSEAVMYIYSVTNADNSISPYCCVVDTDSMTIDNTAVTHVSNWEYSLNRYGKPLQSVYTTLPLDGNVIADVKGYFGKNTAKWTQSIVSIDGNRVTVSTCRAMPGMRIVIGDVEHCVMDVESYWADPDAEAKTYVYVLDSEVANPDSKSIYVSAPCSDRYSRPNSDEFSQTWGETGESTDFNDYTTPGVYRTNNRAFTNGPYTAASYARLEVSYSVVQAQLIQKLYVGGDNANFGLYIRFKRSSTWSPWYKMDMTAITE